MNERNGEEQPTAEKQAYKAIEMNKNIFLASSFNIVAVSKVFRRD